MARMGRAGFRLGHALLLRMDPETAHHITLAFLRLVGRWPHLHRAVARLWAVPDRPVQVWGRTFRHPVGLAAGYDKDGLAWRGLAALGLAFVEVGTVTPRPQPGNPRPRIVRVPEAQALVNWMGFPNQGMAFVAQQTRGPRPPRFHLGINLGRNKTTPNEHAAEDYVQLVRGLAHQADYLVINVSSPNTPGLRDLQQRAFLLPLLRAVRQALQETAANVPLLIKIAPDMAYPALDDLVATALEAGIDGIIATNTTVDKTGLPAWAQRLPGGVSGAPLRKRSTEIVRYLARQLQGQVPIIGVGGILRAEDALEKLEAGASLVQIFTGWVYRGPGLLAEIVHRL